MNRRTLAALTAVAASTVLVSSVHAQQTSRVAAAQTEQGASSATDEVVRALAAYEGAVGEAKIAAQRRLAQAIAQRRGAMAALAAVNPAMALSKSLPAELRSKVPAELRAPLEQEVDATGTVVERISDDFANRTSRHEMLLEVPDSGGPRHFALQFADPTMTEPKRHRLVGRQVKLRGTLIESHIVVGDGARIEVGALASKTKTGSASTSSTSTTVTTTAALSSAIQGNQNTLVVMGNFTDAPLACTQSGPIATLFGASGSVDAHYRESSRGAVSFSGEVIGPFNIPYSASGACDYNAWAAALDAAATAAGKTLSNYHRISYAIPRNASCGWLGLGYVGGATPTRSWVASCSAGVFTHELGHNLSFSHASTPTSEYGDNSDPMGGAPMVQNHGPNKVMAGWQPAGSVVDAKTTGSYVLSSVSLTSLQSAQVMRVPKPDTGEFYYVSLRTASGTDSVLNGAYLNLVSVHRATGTLPTKTYLLADLGAGQAFTDATNGITITPTTISGDGTTISLVTSTPACASASPAIALSPSSQSASSGTTLKYTATVTNKDGSTCSTSTLSMAQALPAGFAGSFSPSSVSLAPGASASVTWSVTSPSGAANASYTLGASVSSASGSTSASGAYVVYSDTVAPTVSVSSPLNGSTMRAGSSLTLGASASDNVGVKSVQFFANGSLVGTSSTAPFSVRWATKRTMRGSYMLTATAIDAAGNSATSTGVKVTLY